jgi:magnesium transporter
MDSKKILEEIKDSIDEVIHQQGSRGKALWNSLLSIHPADIADLLSEINKDKAYTFFVLLPKQLRLEVFVELSNRMRMFFLQEMSESEKIEAFHTLSTDELTDLFDDLSDEDLKNYLQLLHRGVQKKILSLLKFEPDSAGGIMETDVLTLIEDFTVEKSIKIIQRLSAKQEIHRDIFITNRDQKLTGYINLEDLVRHKNDERIMSFKKQVELSVYDFEDQEKIAEKMVHYGLMTVPVINKDGYFLGAISSETLVDVLVEEASEDVQKMAALTPIKHPYFEVPFMKLLLQRSYILVILLFAESFSMTIMRWYEATLNDFLLFFIPMLISAGGNTSSQTSAVVIQGMATGDIGFFNMSRFLKREFLMALFLGSILGIASFFRVFFSSSQIFDSLVISCALGVIVLVSVILGSMMPFFLKKMRIDPAFSAGPFLATVMDVLGIMIYCFIVKLFLF